MSRSKNCNFNFTLKHETPEDFLVSQWQSDRKSLYYVIYRWTVAMIFAVFVISWFICDFLFDQRFLIDFIYLTNLNLILTTVTFCISAWMATLHYRGKSEISNEMTGNLKWLWMMSTTSTTLAVLISLNYWLILYDPKNHKIDLNNIFSHIVNSLILVIDLCVTRQPGRFGSFIYPMSCGIGYLTFTWLYPILGGRNEWVHTLIKFSSFRIIYMIKFTPDSMKTLFTET